MSQWHTSHLLECFHYRSVGFKVHTNFEHGQLSSSMTSCTTSSADRIRTMLFRIPTVHSRKVRKGKRRHCDGETAKISRLWSRLDDRGVKVLIFDLTPVLSKYDKRAREQPLRRL